MKTSEIQNILEKQITEEGLQRIAIDGDWGVGKTYQINKFIEEHKKDKKLSILRVSLFGKKSIDDINNVIYGEIGRGKKFLKEALNFLSHVAFSYKFFSLSIPDMSHWIGEAKFKSDEKVLIIFDDFERKESSLSTKSILGYIDNLCAYNPSVNVALIMCRQIYESKEINNAEIKVFDEFKEKTFNRVLNIDAVDDGAIDTIIENFALKYNLKKDVIEYIKKHFKALKSNNLRILLETLSELSLYLKSEELANVLKGDRLKILINCLTNVIYDCKTNKLLEEYENNRKEMLKNGAIFGDSFDDADDEIDKRISAIMPKCNLIGMSSYTKRDIIGTILKRYLYLDESCDKLLKKYLSSKSNPDDIFESLYFSSYSDRKKRLLKQYNELLKTKDRVDVEKIINDWYENIEQDFIDQNIDFSKLSDALIKGCKERAFCLFQAEITLRWDGYRTSVKEFVENFNNRIYDERIKLVCEKLDKNKKNEWEHLVEYIILYKQDVSREHKLDHRLENCFEKNNYFVWKLKESVTQDEYENICSLVRFYWNEGSESFIKKFEKYLDKEISEATEWSYAQKLKVMKKIGI